MKMNNRLWHKIAGILICAWCFCLTGCAHDIVYPEQPEQQDSLSDRSITTEQPLISHPVFEENPTLDYGLTPQSFSKRYQAEDVFSVESYREIADYEGSGYVYLERNKALSFDAEVNGSQHYRISISVAATDSVIELYSGDVLHGAYYIQSPSAFSTYHLDGVYLRDGMNAIKIKSVRGSAYLDALSISSSTIIPNEKRFVVSPVTANTNASDTTRTLLDYLISCFGKKTLAAQHCTVNTNTEINAIYQATGRYPAIRAGDLSHYSRCYGGIDKNQNQEIELAEQWAEIGGIVYFSWTWYSPKPDGGSHYYASSTDYDLANAYIAYDISQMDLEQLQELREADTISADCLELIKDIDDMAETLKLLRDKDIPVLWRPLMQPATNWFWWSRSGPDHYIWLWQLLFDRMSGFHQLDNLIWIWSGENADYYPGDKYVDIIGEDVYNLTDTSNVTRLNQTAAYGGRKKLAAMSECALVPNPDMLNRDNAFWLFFALYRGDYLVGDNGQHASAYNIHERLHYVYNHELILTLDELDINTVHADGQADTVIVGEADSDNNDVETDEEHAESEPEAEA